MRFSISVVLAGLIVNGGAEAGVPQVVTDIAPVESLVAAVMEGLGEPERIVRRGASPHGYAMRPSEARALQGADVVFWVGPDLEPWLGEAIGKLAPQAKSADLLGTPGTQLLDFRTGTTFASDAHADSDGTSPGEWHPGERRDPHAWLDPENGKIWLDRIATILGELDPGNSDAYEANAAQAKAEVDAAAAETEEVLAGISGLRFVVFHDAYHYFEHRFGLASIGAIELADASAPSPARIEEVRDAVLELGVDCVLSEPQANQGLVRTVVEGTGAHLALIDPLGTDIEEGPDFYQRLIRHTGRQIAACAG